MKTVEDILLCEEQLRSTLHCDDTEKLRKKLALLKREYLRTAQRLQRAERSEAVRKHVRSRIAQQNHQDQTNPDITSNRDDTSSLTLDAQNGTTSAVPLCQGPTEDAEDSDYSRRSQVIRFLLPSDATCSQTPDSSHGAARGQRPSSALRLRSRRSRMRWERRSTEAVKSTDTPEDVSELAERMETAGKKGSEGRVQTEFVNESEELFSGKDSESPSLLLTHWNTCGQSETGNMEGEKTQGGQEQWQELTEVKDKGKKESESASLLLTCWNPAVHAEGREQDGTHNGEREEIEGGERDGRLCEDSFDKDTEQNAVETAEKVKSHDKTLDLKEVESEMVGREHDVKSEGLWDSCTLVEGLLFPAEYYVRTTRRMSSSHSQPDMHAVILSQLNKGRNRRSRGRGRGLNRNTQNHECSERHSQTDVSLLSTASPSVGPCMESQAFNTSDLNSQTSREVLDQISASHIDTDACFSPTFTPARPARGRRRGRGRGRGRPKTPRCLLSLDTHQLGLGQSSDDPQPISSQVSSSLSLQGAGDDPHPASANGTTTHPSSEGNGPQSSSATGRQIYPIFLKNNARTNQSTQMIRSAASWRSLLLPTSQPAQTSLLPLPSLSPGLLANNLLNFDIPQDFHLPDDQFASLKLHKLRQVAVESGVEYFTSPSHNTRSSLRRSEAFRGSSDPLMPLSLPLSLTPMISNSPNPTEGNQASTQCVDLQNLSVEHKFTGELTSQSSTEENLGEQQTENLHPECPTHTSPLESVSVVQDCEDDSVHPCKEKDTVILNTNSHISISASSSNRSVDQPVEPQPHINPTDRPLGKVSHYVISQSEESNVISLEGQTNCLSVVRPLEDQMSANHQTEVKAIKTLSFDCHPQTIPDVPAYTCTAIQACNDSGASEEPPVQHLNMESSAKDSKESSETTNSPREKRNEDKVLRRVHSQLLLSPSLASVPFLTPNLPSCAISSSPTLLPSLGHTPHPDPAALTVTSSPSAQALPLPPPHSPSIHALSPPAPSPCSTVNPLPPSQLSTSLASQIQAPCEPFQRMESAPCPTVPSIPSQGSDGQVGLKTEETAEEHWMECTLTLKAPAGGCLVDACCLLGPSGGLCVAAAGKWAVCLWSQTSASEWNLIHTWAFNEPVINVFPVPDAAGLMYVTLGQLEIREVRMLSCSSFSQLLLCEGLVQAVVGVSKSRVVTSSHSASGSALQVFTLSDGGRPSSQPLVSPGVCVGALAPVDGLSDALIGTDEGGRLFIWNVKTGQLLQTVMLGDGLLHTACLRGYSYCGVLFVLLQHQLLTSLEEEERDARAQDQMFLKEEEEDKEEERKKTTLFSLGAVNPLNGKSVLATRLCPPKAWSGRLSEADVNSSSVVGLSQSGCVCVWELGQWGSSRMVWAPESEGWQLARWGGGGTLVTGHHNGDVTLHCYNTNPGGNAEKLCGLQEIFQPEEIQLSRARVYVTFRPSNY